MKGMADMNEALDEISASLVVRFRRSSDEDSPLVMRPRSFSFDESPQQAMRALTFDGA